MRGVGSAWLLARWLLVLALVFDQLSAPFHHHHHDGADAPADLAASLDSSGGSERDVDGDERMLGSHSAIAIRVDSSRLGQLPAIDLLHAVSAVGDGLRSLLIIDVPGPEDWARSRVVPDFRSHRSLPPNGRAPPLHA